MKHQNKNGLLLLATTLMNKLAAASNDKEYCP